jgi:ATP-binding cassette subfamily B protein
MMKQRPANFKRVVALFDPHRRELAFIGVLVVVAAGIGLVPPLMLERIVNQGLLRNDLGTVSQLSAITILALLLSSGIGWWFGYLSVDLGQRIMQGLRAELFAHLQRMSLRFFTATRTGEIQSRLANDVGGIQSVVSDTAVSILSNVVTVASTLVAMFILDWRLTLMAIGVMPIFAWIANFVGQKARTIREETQKQLADLNSTMSETLSISGALLTKTSGRQGLTMHRFANTNRLLTRANVKQNMVFRSFGTLFQLTFSLTPVLVYWFAGYLTSSSIGAPITIGGIVAFTALQGRLFFPLTSLLSTQVELGSSLALFDRIFEYLDMKVDIEDAPGAITLEPNEVSGEVRFENVQFRYEPEQEHPTLESVSIVAKSGELVALVGSSGAGKTSLAYLIPRLYEVESGSISIDGHDIREIKLESLGRLIGVVTQETYLVHDTIRENLRYGNPDATDAQIISAAKAAAIHDHIASLPEGYETVVGERGYRLSGGEKQRLAIARAILKDPRILILDEATSALDTDSERLVQNALEQLMQGRTTFAIAHRLSTIRRADQIIVLEKGRVVERGTHAQLIEQSGHYRRLHDAQAGGLEVA